MSRSWGLHAQNLRNLHGKIAKNVPKFKTATHLVSQPMGGPNALKLVLETDTIYIYVCTEADFENSDPLENGGHFQAIFFAFA